MYVKKVHKAGRTIEVEKMHTHKYPKGVRAPIARPTAESVKKYNEKLAFDYWRRKINHNFTEDDLHIVLPYRKGYRPGEKELKNDIRRFKEILRKEMKKRGLVFKYVHVVGFYNKDGIPETGYDTHDETSLHHHLVISGIDYKVLTKAWKGENHARLWMYPLDDEGDYTDLSAYLFGHTKNLFRAAEAPYKKRWSCSRNLKEPPQPTQEVVSASSWRKDPEPIKGYKIVTDSIRYGVSEETGYPYQFYRMVEIKSRK